MFYGPFEPAEGRDLVVRYGLVVIGGLGKSAILLELPMNSLEPELILVEFFTDHLNQQRDAIWSSSNLGWSSLAD